MSWAVSHRSLEAFRGAWGERGQVGGGGGGGCHEEWRRWGLSPRLAQVAAFFPLSYAALDIGTDHALLPLALTRSKRAPAAIAADLNAAPLRAAQRRLTPTDPVIITQADGFDALLPARGGDALDALLGDPAHPVCVTICGVGGKLISALMPGAPPRVTRAVLQPNLQHHRVADALAACGWRLEAARLTWEGERLFLTLSARREGALEPRLDPPPAPPPAPPPLSPLDLLLQDDPLYPLWLWIHIEQSHLPASASASALPSAALEHRRARRAHREALIRALSAVLGPPLKPLE